MPGGCLAPEVHGTAQSLSFLLLSSVVGGGGGGGSGKAKTSGS